MPCAIGLRHGLGQSTVLELSAAGWRLLQRRPERRASSIAARLAGSSTRQKVQGVICGPWRCGEHAGVHTFQRLHDMLVSVSLRDCKKF